MEIAEECVNDVHLVKVTGDLTASSAPELKERLGSMIKAGKKAVLVDMGQVGFIDSSGLGTLVGCLQRSSEAGGVLKIACLQDHPKRVFFLTRLERVFELFDGREAALESF